MPVSVFSFGKLLILFCDFLTVSLNLAVLLQEWQLNGFMTCLTKTENNSNNSLTVSLKNSLVTYLVFSFHLFFHLTLSARGVFYFPNS